MSHKSELIENDILKYLDIHEHKTLCRFITCGSVDDGKSTLIGRLLYESKLIYEDQLAALESDSKKDGTQGDAIDFALLVDGLAAEREQGITIDVAYRFFSTEKRKFIVADTPGHEQYTRNMATGASTADVAILMIDARKGILTQTKRHSTIVNMLGVKKIVLAINKMDLVNYSQDIFNQILDDYKIFATQCGITDFTAIAVSALNGDNIIDKSNQMPWYNGQTLLTYLETVSLPKIKENSDFSMPVQWVNRPNLDFRGFSGQVSSGRVCVGDKIKVLPSGKKSVVDKIVTFDGNLKEAIRGQSVTLTLTDEIDISRGDVLVSEGSEIQVASQFQTKLLWMSEQKLIPGAQYWVKTRAKLLSASLSKPDYLLDVNTLEKTSASTLGLNEIGQCVLDLDQDIAFDSYVNNSNLGSFIVIDRLTNNTVAMGLIESAKNTKRWVDRYVEQRNKYWVRSQLTAQQRQSKLGHKPLFILMTGAVEKTIYSTYEKQLEQTLFENNRHCYRYGFQYMKSAGSQTDISDHADFRQEMIRDLVGIGHAFMDAGLLFITGIKQLSAQEAESIKVICAPFEVLIVGIGNTSIDVDISINNPQDITTTLKQAIDKLI
jgi:bifunctional enzyme CysN/CysC